MIILGLNTGAALSAFVAAGFWFISARGKIPKSDKTWVSFLDTPDEIISALRYSAKWNRLAALFAGVSALFMTAAISLGICS
jgi:urea transporter